METGSTLTDLMALAIIGALCGVGALLLVGRILVDRVASRWRAWRERRANDRFWRSVEHANRMRCMPAPRPPARMPGRLRVVSNPNTYLDSDWVDSHPPVWEGGNRES